MSGTIESPAMRSRRRLTVWFAIPVPVVLVAGCIVIGTDIAETRAVGHEAPRTWPRRPPRPLQFR